MNWKTNFRSFYYENAEEPDNIVLFPSATALLVIDIQNTYMQLADDPVEAARWRHGCWQERLCVIFDHRCAPEHE